MNEKREHDSLVEEALADLDRYASGADPRNDPVLTRFLECPSLQQASTLLGSALQTQGANFMRHGGSDPLPIPRESIFPF